MIDDLLVGTVASNHLMMPDDSSDSDLEAEDLEADCPEVAFEWMFAGLES